MKTILLMLMLTVTTNKFMNKIITDERGRVIGREVNGNLLDGQGRMVSRYIESSNMTVDEKGRKVGTGDQRLRQLDK